MREKDWRDEIKKGDILSTLAGDREVLEATHKNGWLVSIRMQKIRNIGGGGNTTYVRNDLRSMSMKPKWEKLPRPCDMERCPTCEQKIPKPPYVPQKVCFDCQKPIERGHKWRYKRHVIIDEIRSGFYTHHKEKVMTIMVHRHCENPDSYTQEKIHQSDYHRRRDDREHAEKNPA